MNLYIASKLDNYKNVLELEEFARGVGHKITHSWSSDHAAQVAGAPLDGDFLTAKKCLRGVLDADLVVVWMPGGRGAHVEMGMAFAAGKPVLIYEPNPERDFTFCSMAHRPVRTLAEVKQYLAGLS